MMTNNSSENPYITPSTESIPLILEEDQRDLATRGERLGGNLLDSFISTVVFIAIVLLAELLIGDPRLKSGSGLLLKTNNLLLVASSTLVYLLIQTPFLHRSGQTLGKIALKTAIVDMSGKKPSLQTLLLRRYGFVAVISLISIAGPFIMIAGALLIFTRQRRCLHDYVAGTKVVSLVRKKDFTDQTAVSESETRNLENEARIFDRIFQERLGLKPGSFPENTDLITELRIPKAELLSFYDEIDEKIIVKDMNVLERCRTYAEAKRTLGLA